RAKLDLMEGKRRVGSGAALPAPPPVAEPDATEPAAPSAPAAGATVHPDSRADGPRVSSEGDASREDLDADQVRTEQGKTADGHPQKKLQLSNLTTCRVLLQVSGGLFVIPPLDTRELDAAAISPEIKARARLAGILDWQDDANVDRSLDAAVRWAAGALF